VGGGGDGALEGPAAEAATSATASVLPANCLSALLGTTPAHAA